MREMLTEFGFSWHDPEQILGKEEDSALEGRFIFASRGCGMLEVIPHLASTALYNPGRDSGRLVSGTAEISCCLK